jgi:hypothetical protein
LDMEKLKQVTEKEQRAGRNDKEQLGKRKE